MPLVDEGRIPAREDVEREIERREKSLLLSRALARLDAMKRAVVVLHDLEGFRVREIAEVLEVPEGTVLSRLYYARRELRGFLRSPQRVGNGGEGHGVR